VLKLKKNNSGAKRLERSAKTGTIPNLPPPSYDGTNRTIFMSAVIFLSDGIHT